MTNFHNFLNRHVVHGVPPKPIEVLTINKKSFEVEIKYQLQQARKEGAREALERFMETYPYRGGGIYNEVILPHIEAILKDYRL